MTLLPEWWEPQAQTRDTAAQRLRARQAAQMHRLEGNRQPARGNVMTLPAIPELLALQAVLDGDDDDARDALAGLLPDQLSAAQIAASRLAGLAGCLARGRRTI